MQAPDCSGTRLHIIHSDGLFQSSNTACRSWVLFCLRTWAFIAAITRGRLGGTVEAMFRREARFACVNVSVDAIGNEGFYLPIDPIDLCDLLHAEGGPAVFFY